MNISRTVILRHLLLRKFSGLLTDCLNGKHFDFIIRSCTNIAEIRRLTYTKTIFVCLHQPFLFFIPLWLCEIPVPLTGVFSELRRRRLNEEMTMKVDYRRLRYRPYRTPRRLIERLRAEENILLAADGKAGKHFYKIRFGHRDYLTPAGIYRLSNTTGAPVVPVFISLTDQLPCPRFRLEIGPPYFFSMRPSDYDSSIEAMFGWFYSCLQKQPYMWNGISEMK